MKYKFSRILLKLSGEALKGNQEHGYQAEAIRNVVAKVKQVLDEGIEVAIVVGAGNLWRGVAGANEGMERVNADQMGMLATVMNALALKEYFNAAGQEVLLQSSFEIAGVVSRFNRDNAIRALEAGKIVIFAGGTGKPYFTTDTAAVISALETDCDAVLKATKVDGVYSADPMRDPNAVRYAQLSFDEALDKKLRVMDAAAFSLCRDNDLPIVVFDFAGKDAILRVIAGDPEAGTIVS
ncbi:MAG: UMP kinase [Victivallaceae bacterium]|nr:UMP kinase [Victivallaceae bacterium]